MKLIGMLDSPFVRRTAIGLSQLGLTFDHQSLSVFKDYSTFRQLNPMVKAPTLLLDDGTALMDSSLILQYAESMSTHSLNHLNPALFAKEQQIVGTALICCEKTVQIVYEYQIRPEDKRHEPWVKRIEQQLQEAYRQLNQLANTHQALFDTKKLSHASIATAVAWNFTRQMRPEQLGNDAFPRLRDWSAECEKTEAFRKYPYDDAMSGGGPWASA
ncbi:glutathione S-transferase family protein [Reinekea blandensis]|uniref:GST N-terminal domain-containing protein n=1 Tax=Reinekea blandensis MED297 TaxID=314283 RepID=A4BCB9_9GAMM|nr:glutathione S-transferase family protein [Reinekea blandensis]EAR10185.1 hypothetical protein MED297_13217 [Reinekea sp. MED297] [Reinekea blandensis MED297]